MKSLPQNCINHMQAKKRTIALALLIFFITFSLLSKAFILTHANHVHDHNGTDGTCATCSQIQNTENILRQQGTAAIGDFVPFTGLYAVVAIIKAIFSYITVLTPVTSKIRMNN